LNPNARAAPGHVIFSLAILISPCRARISPWQKRIGIFFAHHPLMSLLDFEQILLRWVIPSIQGLFVKTLPDFGFFQGLLHVA